MTVNSPKHWRFSLQSNSLWRKHSAHGHKLMLASTSVPSSQTMRVSCWTNYSPTFVVLQQLFFIQPKQKTWRAVIRCLRGLLFAHMHQYSLLSLGGVQQYPPCYVSDSLFLRHSICRRKWQITPIQIFSTISFSLIFSFSRSVVMHRYRNSAFMYSEYTC